MSLSQCRKDVLWAGRHGVDAGGGTTKEKKGCVAMVIASTADRNLLSCCKQALPQTYRPQVGLPHGSVPDFQAVKGQGVQIKFEWTDFFKWMVDGDEGAALPSRVKASEGFFGRIGGKGGIIGLVYSQKVGMSLIMRPFDLGRASAETI